MPEARFWSVMSRAIFEAPRIEPSSALTGEMVTEISTNSPFFRRRTVSK